MLARVLSASVVGIEGVLVQVEVDLAPGLPSFMTVGLPDTSVKESKNRVVAAVRNSGFDFPTRKITVNLAPADLKKEGPLFDLPIAIGVLAAGSQIKEDKLADYCLVGELALDGSLRPVKGVLPMAMEVKSKGQKGLILPTANAAEAAVVKGISVVPLASLVQVVSFLNGEKSAPSVVAVPAGFVTEDCGDFSEVKGQTFAKRALEIAASGGHNIVFIGPPGSGKTMLARRLPGILPEMSFEESLEATKIHSVCGLLKPGQSLVTQRPFRAPHHTISDVALVGGGVFPRPGEISLAHHGVLFLDELPEFHRNVLEALRQPLEEGTVHISRAAKSSRFPTQFLFVGAMNPCPCGFSGHPEKSCACTPYQIQRYISKISGPLLDRIDLHVEVPALRVAELLEPGSGAEQSAQIAQRVKKTRRIQQQRGPRLNAAMSSKHLKQHCLLDSETKSFFHEAAERLGLSARGFDRVLKVARTIADLAGEENIGTAHIAEAISYRSLDRVPAMTY